MSTCLSGAAAYRLESLDIEMIKSAPSTTSWISSSSSPSSAISDSSPLAISTRKARTPRKRPNQIYGEAAALLSTAYPKLFPPADTKFANPSFPFEPSPDLLVEVIGFSPRRPSCVVPFVKACRSPCRSLSEEDGELDFDAESIVLDEGVSGEGIDCIMGDFSADYANVDAGLRSDFCYGYPVGLGFEAGEIGMRKGARAIRDGGEDGDWWRFPSVNAADLNQKPAKGEKRKKKKNASEIKDSEIATARSNGLLLKLDYDGVLDAWSDKSSPFSGDKVAGGNVRLGHINLFPENGGTREASLLRFREKKRNRLFSKKITYQVRKVNADRRPRMKGRFVRTRDSDD